MSVRGNSAGCSKKSGPSSIKSPNPRHSRKGYEEHKEARRIQSHPGKKGPQKRKMILKGTSHPVGSIPGVGAGRENAWKDYQVEVLNESLMRGRGNRRSFHREQPGSGRRR